MNNILFTRSEDSISLVLQDSTTKKVSGYMFASLDHVNVYKVVRVVADRGLGIPLYSAVMMAINAEGLRLTSSGDEMNSSSCSLWERLVVVEGITAYPLDNMPSMEGIPLFLSEDDQTIEDDNFLNNSYTMKPDDNFINNLTTTTKLVMDKLIHDGENMFFKRYYNKA